MTVNNGGIYAQLFGFLLGLGAVMFIFQSVVNGEAKFFFIGLGLFVIGLVIRFIALIEG